MSYLTCQLSVDGVSGTGPEAAIAARGGNAEASWAVDTNGIRVGYLTVAADLTGLDAWDVTEVTEAKALAFCRKLYADAALLDDGYISGPTPPS